MKCMLTTEAFNALLKTGGASCTFFYSSHTEPQRIQQRFYLVAKDLILKNYSTKNRGRLKEI